MIPAQTESCSVPVFFPFRVVWNIRLDILDKNSYFRAEIAASNFDKQSRAMNNTITLSKATKQSSINPRNDATAVGDAVGDGTTH